MGRTRGVSFSLMPGQMQSVGLGIDLVSLSRLKKFLASHSVQACKLLLSRSERFQLSKSTRSLLLWAKFFSAKEAYFKTLNQSWLGVEGFSDIVITPTSKHSFSACLKSRSNSKQFFQATGSWTKTKDHVIAQVFRYQK